MAKLYIFGIGGTGSRVLRSFTMLMAAGVKLSAHEIVPIIIDPDSANADLTRTVKAMNDYQAIRDSLTFAEGNANMFYRSSIRKILPNFMLRINDTDDKTFKQFIGLSSMGKENQSIVRMLFSDKNLRSNMNVGFKGNPNIGSVVLNQIVNSDDFADFANSFEQGDKVFIVSSIFGGTGASGFPLLLKTLRTGDSFQNNDLINKAEIGAITVLPYFSLKQDSESEIDSSTFISKTKSALAYYESNISKNNQINALYYLADTITKSYENHEGGESQRNDAHLIEFLAATAIIDFCNKAHDTTVNKELGLKDNCETVSFDSFYSELTGYVRKPLTQFSLVANCFKEKWDYISSKQFNANNKGIGIDVYESTFGRNLKKLFKDYEDWLSEMKSNKRSLDLFNMNCGDKPFDVVTGIKAKKVFSKLSDYSLFFDRINGAVKDCTSSNPNDKLLEAFYRGTEKLTKEKFNF